MIGHSLVADPDTFFLFSIASPRNLLNQDTFND
jgi:hypothetical protein